MPNLAKNAEQGNEALQMSKRTSYLWGVSSLSKRLLRLDKLCYRSENVSWKKPSHGNTERSHCWRRHIKCDWACRVVQGRHSLVYTTSWIMFSIILIKQSQWLLVTRYNFLSYTKSFNWLVNLNLAKIHTDQTESSCWQHSCIVYRHLIMKRK